MSGVWGNNIQLSIFGESHGNAIGGVLCGLPAGFKIDFEKVDFDLARRNHRAAYSTPRNEPDTYELLSGVLDDTTTGSPLAFMIRNRDTKSHDYSGLDQLMRPGHADYPAFIKYGGYNDIRGGGHFSGRITAPLVLAGAVARQMLAQKGITVCSHICSIGTIEDTGFKMEKDTAEKLNQAFFGVLDTAVKERMLEEIRQKQAEKDSVGGVLECIITGVPAGIGEPFFGSVESRLASMLFSIPAVKGVEFGEGFGMTKMTGYQANDSYYYDGDTIKTRTNHNGGILGGITNGMPLTFRLAVKPTASIAKEQDTVNIKEKKDAKLVVKGRHDACIVPRAAVVAETAAALVLLDMLIKEF